MGKLRCPCGSQLSNVISPSRNNGWLLRDVDLEKENADPIGDGVDVWECFDCGRIAFGNKKDNAVKWFSPDSGKPEKICDFDS